jgi:hypothetical protein
MPVAFGSLFDLARLRIGGASAETCDACNTINPVHALACKCCAHKLPAFHARMRGGFGGGTLNPLLLCRNALLETERAWNAMRSALSIAARPRTGLTRDMVAAGPRK